MHGVGKQFLMRGISVFIILYSLHCQLRIELFMNRILILKFPQNKMENTSYLVAHISKMSFQKFISLVKNEESSIYEIFLSGW